MRPSYFHDWTSYTGKTVFILKWLPNVEKKNNNNDLKNSYQSSTLHMIISMG